MGVAAGTWPPGRGLIVLFFGLFLLFFGLFFSLPPLLEIFLNFSADARVYPANQGFLKTFQITVL